MILDWLISIFFLLKLSIEGLVYSEIGAIDLVLYYNHLAQLITILSSPRLNASILQAKKSGKKVSKGSFFGDLLKQFLLIFPETPYSHLKKTWSQ